MRSQVDDLTEVISAKDAQLAVLKVRLDEADQLLKSRTEALESAQCERSRIIQDCNEGSSLHNQTLQTLQERLREADSTLKREQESYRQMQTEFAARLSKVEAERQSLAESLTAAERKSMEEKRRAEELQQQLKSAKAGTESVKQELIDYKQKATRILQDTENLLMTEGESSREQLQELQDQITSQKQSKQEAEAELERQKQEFQYLEEELHRTKNSLQSRIKDREEEVQKLRNQLTNKTLSNSSQTELENRLHFILGRSGASLVHCVCLCLSRRGVVSIPQRGARMRNVPVLFSDGESTDAGMYRRVRNAASTIDRFRQYFTFG
ncbi:UNVERIFIED_CONTAM: hypothetical protein FKN15_030396 [Acipenser sinensis]